MPIIALFLLFINICLSQTLLLNFEDEKSGQKLSGANIILESNTQNKIGKVTDSDGRVYFNNLQLQNYTVSFSYIGYASFESKINIYNQDDYVFNFSCKSIPILLPQLKIIGSVNSKYSTIPGASYVLNLQQLKIVQPIGTQEILENVPGIYGFADDGIGNSRISIGIRGLDPRRSARALILEDGIPIQPALYIYPNMYYNPPVERIDGVQIIKGSAAIKYGPHTMGGVINYYTRRPSNKKYITQNINIGTNGYQSYFAELNGLGNSNFKNSIQFLLKKGNGFRQNNSFEQLNMTTKTSINVSDKKNIFIKSGINYENSNATYTGLTMYSFLNNPDFNPKEHDNFKTFRLSLDLIATSHLFKNLTRTKKFYSSFFDRQWWRENDIFVSESDLENEISFNDIHSYSDIIRVGNGKSNFGIMRKFYILGFDDSYIFDTYFLNSNIKFETGYRIHWERFIDDRVVGDKPDARKGIYYYSEEIWNDNGDGIVQNDEYDDFNQNGVFDPSPTIIGKSHHYETTALASFIRNTINIKNTSITSGLRFELFEQERIDLLDGATYLDKTSHVLLPGLGIISKFNNLSIFGGIHRGYTAPSSGTLSVVNGLNLDSGLDLRSEKSWNKEIGLRGIDIFSFLSVEFAFFHNDIEDLIAAGRSTAFENLGHVTNSGTELAAEIDFKKMKFLPKIYFSHTFLKSHIKSANLATYDFMEQYPTTISIAGNRLPYTPENVFIVGVEKEFFKKITVRVDYKFIDEYFTDFHNIKETDISGNYGLVNANSIINFSILYNISDKISLSIVGKNIEDKIYIGSRLHSSPFQPSANISSGIIPGARKQINISLKMNF
tara:strand:+ start:756 stop:3266 length:2511 start_codon:yes stop_codon:yes gene_type:complete